MKIPTTSDDFQNEFYSSIDLMDKIGDLRIRQLVNILDKVNDEIIIGGIIKIFKNTKRPNTEYVDQKYAGKILNSIKPKTEIDLILILKDTIKNWNKSVEELPFWLKENYGITLLKNKLAEFENQSLNDIESEKLIIMKWWLKI
ncbi:hypothetical protein [Flavobacterium sp. PL02]|uniref:hypothetical protein n=1 Tax=Flavobacterium sp. PL02 TaxID=3088354 RepID=UPI002B23AAB4|nr:hypothetical protein [Flavobacterium sp. PL02]MEA9411598.1 hypothetical protein [Flavobacterium sp. PL02]